MRGEHSPSNDAAGGEQADEQHDGRSDADRRGGLGMVKDLGNVRRLGGRNLLETIPVHADKPVGVIAQGERGGRDEDKEDP